MRYCAANVLHRREFLGDKIGNGMDTLSLDHHKEVICAGHQIAARHFREAVYPFRDIVESEVLLRRNLYLYQCADARRDSADAQHDSGCCQESH